MNRLQRGFTLVEMLVSIGIAALLIGLAYGTVMVGHNSARSVDRTVSAMETMSSGWTFLREAIAHARAVADPDDADDPTGFHGHADGLAFVADLPGQRVPGGLLPVRLHVDRDERRPRLLLTYGLSPADDVHPPAQAVLVEALDSIDIRYLGQTDDGPRWHDSWEKRPRLPSLVRIAVRPLGVTDWPVLIARPLTGASQIGGDRPVPDAPSTDDRFVDAGRYTLR